MPIAWAIGAGAGLSLLAGLRSFIPLAVFMLMARLGWMWGFNVQGTDMDFLFSNAAIGILLVVVVLEILITRIPSLARIDVWLRLPLAIVIGALLFAAAIAGEISSPVHFAGLLAGALLAALGLYVRLGLVLAGSGKDPGPALDFSVLILAVLMMLAPPAGYLVLQLGLWLGLRVRRLKRRKYKGLRVLA